MSHETSAAAEAQRKNLKDADVQVMIDSAAGRANEVQNSEDEVQLLKLKLEEVPKTVFFSQLRDHLTIVHTISAFPYS